MLTIRKSLKQLVVVDGEVMCSDGSSFDRVAYSRFKYGFLPPAIEYGKQLAALVADELFDVAGDRPIIVVSAPYKYLPTASEAIARAMLQELSLLAVLDGREPPVLLPFGKTQVGDSSYARSSEADRLAKLATLGLHIDERRIPGSHVLVVDDIRITGTAQKATATYLEQLDPASIWYLHAARLPEDVGKEFPHLESELNETVPHSLRGFFQEMLAGEFQLNTRVLRYILETEDTEEFRLFLGAMPIANLVEIHQAAVGTGVEYYRKHRHNLDIVYDFVLRRSVQPDSSAATAC